MMLAATVYQPQRSAIIEKNVYPSFDFHICKPETIESLWYNYFPRHKYLNFERCNLVSRFETCYLERQTYFNATVYQRFLF